MAHFYGMLDGSRGPASRCGTKASGLHVTAASWDGAITVRLYECDGQNFARISFQGWHGGGRDLTIYNGPVNPKDSEIFAAMAVHAKAALNIDGE